MAMRLGPPAPAARKSILHAATAALGRRGGLAGAWFAERIDGDSLVVGYRSAPVSELSDKTVVRRGRGLAGRVFAQNKVEWVDDYLVSPEITHDYDEAIRAESLQRVIGAPVWADGEFVGVIMAGSREGATFGNRAAALIEAAAQRTSDALTAALLRERLAVLEAAVDETTLRLRALDERDGSSFGRLRRRERDVLSRVALGQTNRDIARAMQLSEHTVKSYLRNLMERLGARNRVEAIACARDAGLL